MKESLENIAKDPQYNKIADEFEKADQEFPDVTRPVLYSILDKIGLEGKNILDIGCGYGEDVAYFSSKGAKAYGIDISDKMVELTKKRCPDVITSVAAMEKMPYQNEMLNIVFSRYAIQHSTDVERIFSEVDRILKYGGDFVFLVTHPFRQYLEKETKDYWKQENVKSTILGGKVVVEEPSHTMAEYINSPSLKYKFRLFDMKEIYDPAADQTKTVGSSPSVLIMHYKKL